MSSALREESFHQIKTLTQCQWHQVETCNRQGWFDVGIIPILAIQKHLNWELQCQGHQDSGEESFHQIKALTHQVGTWNNAWREARLEGCWNNPNSCNTSNPVSKRGIVLQCWHFVNPGNQHALIPPFRDQKPLSTSNELVNWICKQQHLFKLFQNARNYNIQTHLTIWSANF